MPRQLAVKIIISLAIAAALGLFLLTLTGLLTPVYTDEIVWKATRDRLIQDKGIQISTYPQCEREFLGNADLFTAPAAILASGWYAAIYQFSHPWVIKWLGVLSALLWIGLALILIRRLDPDRSWMLFSLSIVAPLAMGTLPLIQGLNRPDQTEAIGVIFLSLCGIYPRKNSWQAALLIIGLAMFLLQHHAEFVLFTPLLLVVIFKSIRSRLAQAITALFCFVMICSTMHYAYESLSCSNDSTFEKVLGVEFKVRSNPTKWLEPFLASHEGETPFGPCAFSPKYIRPWIATPNVSFWDDTLFNVVIRYFIIGLMLATTALGVRAFARDCRSRRFSTRNLLSMALLLSGLAFVFFAPAPPFYRGALIAQTWILALILCEKPELKGMPEYLKQTISALILIAAILSEARLAGRTMPQIEEWLTGGYLPSTIYSFSPFHFEKSKERILKAARTCGINPNRTNRFLLGDELVHEVFKANEKYPVYVAYLTDRDADKFDFVQIFSKANASGAIGQCETLSRIPSLLSVLRNTEVPEICCIPGTSFAVKK